MSIQEHLNKIRNAIYGREVRESIAKGIETAYDDASEKDNANMEVKIARGTHPNLRSRLEEVDNKQQQTTAQLDQKADKGNVSVSDINKNLGKLDQTYMTDEFLQQMAGTTPINAVPADGSLTTPKYGRKSVTPDKTDFIEVGKNLFDKSKIIKNKYWGVSGVFPNQFVDMLDTLNISCIPLIPVSGGERIYKNKVGGLQQVKSDLSFVGQLSDMSTPAGAITLHPDTRYIGVNFHTADADTYQLELGDQATAYMPYHEPKLSSDIKVTAGSLEGAIYNAVTLDISLNEFSVTMGKIKYVFIKQTVPYTDGGTYQNQDTWRIQKCFVNDVDIVNGGAWEMAIEVENLPDFMGTFHGYELMDDIYFYIDGKKVTSGTHTADNLKVAYGAKLIRQGTQNDVVADISRLYDFKSGKLNLTQKIKWRASLDIKNAYLSMLPILPSQSHTYLADFNNKEYSLSDPDTVSSDVRRIYVPNVKRNLIYGDSASVDISVDYEDSSIANHIFLYPHNYYNKIYYSYARGYTTKIDETWRITTVFDVKSLQ